MQDAFFFFFFLKGEIEMGIVEVLQVRGEDCQNPGVARDEGGIF
jgi:hypothetical protein